MNTNKNLLGTLFLTIGVFACTFSAQAISFAVINSVGAEKESSALPGYKAFYCTTDVAADIFGSEPTIDKITAYLTKDTTSYTRGMSDLATKGGVQFDVEPTFDEGKYSFYKSLQSLEAGNYFAVLAYDVSEKYSVRVFNSSTENFGGDNAVVFDPSYVSGGKAGDWATVNVPEPTSGLLLLLGVAGLALKRKRA